MASEPEESEWRPGWSFGSSHSLRPHGCHGVNDDEGVRKAQEGQQRLCSGGTGVQGQIILLAAETHPPPHPPILINHIETDMHESRKQTGFNESKHADSQWGWHWGAQGQEGWAPFVASSRQVGLHALLALIYIVAYRPSYRNCSVTITFTQTFFQDLSTSCSDVSDTFHWMVNRDFKLAT